MFDCYGKSLKLNKLIKLQTLLIDEIEKDLTVIKKKTEISNKIHEAIQGIFKELKLKYDSLSIGYNK